MTKLRIGVLMEDCLPTEGGGYSYYQTLLMAIDHYNFDSQIEIVNLDFADSTNGKLKFDKPVIRINRTVAGNISFKLLTVLYKAIHRLLKSRSKVYLEFISQIKDRINNSATRRVLISEKIHLAYYLKPKENLVDYPMVITHWDVGHKSMYPFPEVAWDGNLEKRHRYYQAITNKAFLILCESESGARELQHYYPINPNRIRVMPLFGGDVLQLNIALNEQQNILSKYGLKTNGFFLYPAQFWVHKNHSTLLNAFNALLKEHSDKSLKLVLCGGDQGNLSYIKEIISELGLTGNVLIPGFISDAHLYTFYKNAISLVMPTFLGPTNIPLIEAAQLQCAISCSALEGHREILGDNALYFDPANAGEIKSCMQQVLNSEFRKQLVSSAHQHIQQSSFQVQRSIPLLDKFLLQLKPIRTTWGMSIKLLFAFAKLSFLSIN